MTRVHPFNRVACASQNISVESLMVSEKCANKDSHIRLGFILDIPNVSILDSYER